MIHIKYKTIIVLNLHFEEGSNRRKRVPAGRINENDEDRRNYASIGFVV